MGAGYSYTDQSAWSSPFSTGFSGPQINFGSGSISGAATGTGITITTKTLLITLAIAAVLFVVLKKAR